MLLLGRKNMARRNAKLIPSLKANKVVKLRLNCIFKALLVIASISIILSVRILSVRSSQVEEERIIAAAAEFSRPTKNYIKLRSDKSFKKPVEDKEEYRYSMIFSTGCTPLQHWQSLAFFYFAYRIKQPGNVTRIVSGCNSIEAGNVRKTHQEKIVRMSERFHLHITPDYGFSDDQKYWNKPHGILNWMEKKMGFSDNRSEHDDDIIIIMDPDMILFKPIRNDFSDFEESSLWVGENKRDRVTHGTPFAQVYGFGNLWLTTLKGNLSSVVGNDSAALNVTMTEAKKYFPAGPPYIATGKDMYALVKHWVKFLPGVHSLYPEFMAEMHAYSVAAAHLQLRHQLAKAFMVSEINPDEEKDSFKFLKSVTKSEACRPKIPVSKMPFALHYCQRYAVGRWFFSKYKLQENFFDCNAALMKEPPHNVADIYNWFIFPNGKDKGDYSSPSKRKFLIRHTWYMCTLVFELNEAATSIKKVHCGPDANFEKTFQFHRNSEFLYSLQNTTKPF